MPGWRPWTAALLALFGGLVSASETRSESGTDESERRLQIPLERTTALRAQFETELRALKGDDLRAFYTGWIDRIGANGITDTLKRVEPGCHGRGHDLGKLLFEKIGEIQRALASCDEVCNSGCMHGVFRQAMSGEAARGADGKMDPLRLAKRVEADCGANGEYPIGDCIHGLGHAFMYEADYDVEAAIGYCERLGDHARKYYCATGAYMELANNPPSGYLDGKSIYFPCDRSPYPAACFRYRFPVSLPEFYGGGGKFPELASGCEALANPYRLGCFHGIGNGHLRTLIRTPETLGELCGRGSRDDQAVCIEGAMERMARYHNALAQRACASLGDWRKAVCDESLKRGLYSMDRSFALYPR